jgi:fibronectin type 3 domain-containing protein
MLARFLSFIVAGLLLALFSASTTAATVSYTSTLATGWNLVGNSTSTALDVKTLLGTQASSVTSVWKWNATTSKWAFYSPALDAQSQLATYAGTKGYDVLSSINAGEGFWINVNATAGLVLGVQNGTGFALGTSTLKPNWNLVATGDDSSPAVFSTTVGNVTTLWAWNSANNGWYFYAPSAASNGTLASYISSKSYQDFGSTTLGNGRGFWVNYAGSGTGGTGGTTPPTTTCLLTGTASAVVGGVAGPLVANYCYALTAPFTCDARGMGVTATFIDEMFKAGFTNVTTAATTYTPLTDCTQAPTNTQAGTFLRTIDGNGSVTTLAGKALPAPLSVTDPLVDGTAADARFALKGQFGASGVVSDGTSLFVLDQGYYAIRKVNIATGATTTLAGGTRDTFYAPGAMAIDAAKANLYVTDYRYIRKIEIATGIVTTVVGLATYFDASVEPYGQTVNGHFDNASTGVQDWFNGVNAEGIVADATSLYVLDEDRTGSNTARILKVDIATMTVTNFTTISNYTPSSSSTSFLLDGGNLYLAGNQQVRKINLTTKVETLVAGGSASSLRDGIGAAAQFRNITAGMASDGTHLYVTDNSAIRKIELATGIVSTIAGKEASGYADGMGAAAKFSGLGGMTMVGTYLYATDNFSTIRRIQTNGTGGTTPTPVSNSTVTTGPLAGTWSYNSPGGAAWSQVTDTTVPNGGAVYKAAAVAQDQSTIASITVTQAGNGVVSFYKKVSSMACCDYLVFTIDGVEPANARWSGNVTWSPASFTLTAGTHTLRWSYVKGSATFVNTAGVQDTAWISQVAVTAAPPMVSGLAPASGAIASLSKILGTDLNNFSPLPTVNFNAGNTNYPAIAPYALSADYSSLEFAVPQDLAAGDYSVTLGNGAAAAQTAGTFTIPALGTQMGGARQGAALNLGSVVSTPATLAAAVSGMTTDGKNLYVAASGIIYRVAMTSGEVSVLAGGATPVRTSNFGQQYCTPADGLGALASFCGTGQLTTDGTNLYYSDTLADLVRKIVIATGQVTTLPGLFRVNGITTDGTYVYAISNTNPQLTKIDIATGVMTVVAGSGISSIVDGTGTAAYFKAPSGLTTDGINLYVTDGNTIRKVNPASGVVSTFAGSATVAGFADGLGTAATFSAPTGITTDGTSLYVTDTQHLTGNTLRKIDIASGTVTTLPISSFSPLTTDGTNLYGTTLVNGQYGIRKVQSTRSAGATAPAIVSTTVLSATKASLSWAPVTGVTGVTTYNIYRSTSPNVALTSTNKVNALAGPIAALEYTDSTLASATTYYYKVTGVITASTDTTASNEIWLKTLAAPNAPAGLAATAAGTTKIDLNWTAVSGAVSYNIYQSRSPSVQLTTTNKLATAATGLTTQITGLSASTLYYYKVTAVNANGESLGSNEASVTTTALPAMVTGVTVTTVNATQISLSWTAVAGAASYNVYDGNTSSLVGNSTQTTFSATGLPVTTYRFFVRAVNAGGEVSVQPSTTVTATTLARPAAPTGATGTAASATQFNISWTAVTGATGYNVYRGTTVGFSMDVTNKLNAALLTTVAYSDTALTANTTYFYNVTAVTAAGESLGSTEFSVSPPLPTIPGLVGGTIQLGPLNLAANVSTIAGSTASGVVNGAGTAASFMGVTSMATDGSYLYLVDAPAVKVRKMELATGIVSAVAGDGSYGVFGQPQGITTDGVNLYVTNANFKKIHKIVIATGVVSLFAGSGYSGLTDGQAANATFNNPAGITTDGANLYVLDSGNSAIRKIVIATGVVSTLSQSYLGYSESSHITHDGTNLYVTNSVQGRVLKIAMATGATTILAGTGTATTLNSPQGITTDGTNLYVSEATGYTIRKIVIATGAVTTLAGAGTTGYVDGVASAAKFSSPAGMTSDGTNLYVGDGTKIRKIQ